MMQVRRRLSSDDSEDPAVERTAAGGDGSCTDGAAAGSPRPPSHSRRSSNSGASTESDAPSSNGLSDHTPVFDDNAAGASQPAAMSRAVKDQWSSTESAPPVPPPRRFTVPQPGSGEVWQRHAVRPATDGVHRRVLAAVDNGPSSTPKSCPSSPLLDNVGLRRGGVPQDGVRQSQVVSGRRTQPSSPLNDREAAVRVATSAPVTRRTKLPLSPLVRTQRDVR